MSAELVAKKLRNYEKWPPHILANLKPILPLLCDPTITNIEINGYDDIWCKGSGWVGHRKMEGVRFQDHKTLRSLCVTLTEVTGKPINEAEPIYDGRLPGGERLNMVVDPCCARCSINIRKFPLKVMTASELLEKGSISPEIFEMIRSLVLAKRTLMVSGGTDSGKTTFLNVCTSFVPETRRVVTSEENRELQVPVPNQVNLETRPSTDPKLRNVQLSDLVVNNLRMTPDIPVVGEIRGPESLYYLRLMSTGHRGGMSTIHADSAYEALEQIHMLAMLNPDANLPAPYVALMVSKAINIVIHVAELEEDGSRKVIEILEMERSGVRYLPYGVTEYRTRTLVEWETTDVIYGGQRPKVVGHWNYPHPPSQALRKTLTFKRLQWPEVSLKAPAVEIP